MCLRVGVYPLSYSSFDPSMNCSSPVGTANLLSKIGLSKGPRHTGGELAQLYSGLSSQQ